MNFYYAIILILLTICINNLLSEIIFEDNFDEIDSSKWQFVGKKAECGKLILHSTCNTNRIQNLRLLSGKLCLSIKREAYFEARYTTASIISKRSFIIGSGLLFRVRAALPIFEGIIPRVFLFEDQNDKPISKYLTIVNYNNKLLDDILSRPLHNLTTDLAKFQEYEMQYEKGVFNWRLNGLSLVEIRESNNIRDYLDSAEPIKPNVGYKLAMTLDIDTKRFSRITFGLNFFNFCRTLIIDSIQVFRTNKSENISNDTSKQNVYLNRSLDDKLKICRRINDEIYKTPEGFIPANFTDVLLRDEFDGNILDENKWVIKAHDNFCEKIFYSKEKSCDTLGYQNLRIENGTLKLLIKEETYLGHNYTGVTIETKQGFKYGRIEIKAKRPVGKTLDFGIYMQAYDDVQSKNVTGRVDVARVRGRGTTYKKRLYIDKDKFLESGWYRHKTELDGYQVYGIEWTSSYIQWFFNDQVVYQANPAEDQRGQIIKTTNDSYHLPFDYPFNLLIHIGVEMFDLDHYHGNSDWETTWLEIDYVRVYGEISDQSNQTETIQGETYTRVNMMILTIIALIIIMVILLVVIGILWRNQRNKSVQDTNNEFYDDLEMKNEIYQDPDYSEVNDYAQTTFYTNEYLEIFEMPEELNENYIEMKS